MNSSPPNINGKNQNKNLSTFATSATSSPTVSSQIYSNAKNAESSSIKSAGTWHFIQIYQTQKTRLQVHRCEEQCDQNIPSMEAIQLYSQRQVLSLLLDMQWDRKLYLFVVWQTQTQ